MEYVNINYVVGLVMYNTHIGADFDFHVLIRDLDNASRHSRRA